MLKNLMVKDFVEELASSSPAPGGGSIAALAGSLASALSSMVFNLTVGKKAFEELDDEKKEMMKNSLEDSNDKKGEFLDLMERDTEAFLKIMASFRMPKETEEEKNARSQKIQEGYKNAIEIPLEVAKKAFAMYGHIEKALKYGNKNAASDAGVAALLLQTAIEGAALNVKINIPSIKDEQYRNSVGKEINQLISEGNSKKQYLLSLIEL